MKAFKVIAIIIIVVTIVVCLFIYAAQPVEVAGFHPIPPYHDRELVLTEKLSYIFRTPRVGDVVVYHGDNPLNLGRIIGIENNNGMDEYLIQQGNVSIGNVTVTKDKIIGRVYYP